jgi:hypothetical protein
MTEQEGFMNKSPFNLNRTETKRALTLGGLGLILLVAVYANEGFVRANSRGLAGRGLASVNVDPAAAEREVHAEHVLAQRLASGHTRQPSSLGQVPSQMEQLAFGELEGKYAIHLDNSKIASIRFADSPDQSDRPKYITNWSGFLQEHRELFAVNFDHVTKGAQFQAQSPAYDLVQGTATVGRVEVQLDEYGRFLGLQIKK